MRGLASSFVAEGSQAPAPGRGDVIEFIGNVFKARGMAHPARPHQAEQKPDKPFMLATALLA